MVHFCSLLLSKHLVHYSPTVAFIMNGSLKRLVTFRENGSLTASGTLKRNGSLTVIGAIRRYGSLSLGASDAIKRYDSLINFVAIGHVGSLYPLVAFHIAGSLH